MMKGVASFATAMAPARVRAYGLIFHDHAGNPADSAAQPDGDPILKELQGTPSLVVAPATARTFGALDFPFVVVTDGAGHIQYLGSIAGNAFDPNGYMDQVVGRIPGVPDQPRDVKPAAGKPAIGKPSIGKPLSGKPASGEPLNGKSAGNTKGKAAGTPAAP
jgi:hypothetical protein